MKLSIKCRDTIEIRQKVIHQERWALEHQIGDNTTEHISLSETYFGIILQLQINSRGDFCGFIIANFNDLRFTYPGLPHEIISENKASI